MSAAGGGAGGSLGLGAAKAPSPAPQRLSPSPAPAPPTPIFGETESPASRIISYLNGRGEALGIEPTEVRAVYLSSRDTDLGNPYTSIMQAAVRGRDGLRLR